MTVATVQSEFPASSPRQSLRAIYSLLLSAICAPMLLHKLASLPVPLFEKIPDIIIWLMIGLLFYRNYQILTERLPDKDAWKSTQIYTSVFCGFCLGFVPEAVYAAYHQVPIPSDWSTGAGIGVAVFLAYYRTKGDWRLMAARSTLVGLSKGFALFIGISFVGMLLNHSPADSLPIQWLVPAVLLGLVYECAFHLRHPDLVAARARLLAPIDRLQAAMHRANQQEEIKPETWRDIPGDMVALVTGLGTVAAALALSQSAAAIWIYAAVTALIASYVVYHLTAYERTGTVSRDCRRALGTLRNAILIPLALFIVAGTLAAILPASREQAGVTLASTISALAWLGWALASGLAMTGFCHNHRNARYRPLAVCWSLLSGSVLGALIVSLFAAYVLRSQLRLILPQVMAAGALAGAVAALVRRHNYGLGTFFEGAANTAHVTTQAGKAFATAVLFAGLLAALGAVGVVYSMYVQPDPFNPGPVNMGLFIGWLILAFITWSQFAQAAFSFLNILYGSGNREPLEDENLTVADPDPIATNAEIQRATGNHRAPQPKRPTFDV